MDRDIIMSCYTQKAARRFSLIPDMYAALDRPAWWAFGI